MRHNNKFYYFIFFNFVFCIDNFQLNYSIHYESMFLNVYSRYITLNCSQVIPSTPAMHTDFVLLSEKRIGYCTYIITNM